MDTLSNTNDIPGLLPGLVSFILAGVVALLLVRFRAWNLLNTLRCSRLSYAFLLAGATGVLAIVMAFLQPTMSWGGADAYFARAVNLVQHGVYGTGLESSALFPPGYTFLLLPLTWLLEGSRWAFFLTNLTLLVSAALFVRWALLRLGYREGLSNIVSLVIFLSPNRLLSTLLPFSDVPFSLLVLGAFLALIVARGSPGSWGWLVLCGFLAGAAALVRSSGLLLLVPLAAGFLLPGADVPGRRWRNAALVLAVACAVLAPWTVRNYVLFDRFVPVSNNGGLNLAVGNNPSNPVARNSVVDSLWAREEAWASVGGKEWNEAQRDSFFASLGVHYMREHPLTTLSLGVQRVAFTMAADSYSFGALQTYTNMRTLVFTVMGDRVANATLRLVARNIWVAAYHLLYIVTNAIYYLLLMLVLVALVRRPARDPAVQTTFVLIVAAAWLLVFVTFGMSRYKEPIGALLPVVAFLSLCRPGRGEEPRACA